MSLNSDATVALIGASLKDESGLVDSGVVYLYTRSGGTWTYQRKLLSFIRETGDQSGYNTALNAKGDIALIGTIGNRFENTTQAGAVHFYADLTKRPELL